VALSSTTGAGRLLIASALLFVTLARLESRFAGPIDEASSPNSSQGNQAGDAFVGILMADRATTLLATLDGMIVSLPAKRGDHVVAGQTLVRMASPTLSATDLVVAEAQVKRAKADAALARLEHQKALSRQARVTSLSEQNLVSRQQAEEAQFDVLLAAARITAADSAVDHAQAMAQRQSELLSQLESRAPFSGVITEQFASVGTSVTRGTALLRLISPQPLRVKFAIPAAARAQLRVGMALSLRLRNPEVRLTARLQSISAEVDSASQTMTAEGIVDAQGDAGATSSLVGRSVTVSIADGPNRD
jgi:RND family efflux transporter MFP subunit